MKADKTYTDSEADVQLSFFVQIPQGTPIELEIKVEPGQYTFYLNKTILKQIEEAREIGCSLYIPSKLLAYIWYYNCFSEQICVNKNTTPYQKLVITKKNFKIFDDTFIISFIKLFWNKSLQKKSTLQYGITFNSYYREDTSDLYLWKEQDIVLQSNILFYGDIIHKIKSDFIKNPECLNIVYLHYWLIEQILSCLRTKLNLFSWELASLFPATFFVWRLNLAFSLSILAGLVTSVVFATIRYWLVNQLPRWTYISYQYRNWLAWGLSCVTSSIFIFTPTNFLFLLLLSLTGPLLQWVFSFIVGQIGKVFMRWLLA
ncbi:MULTISPECIES: hypothetical protein [unclassified Nostoc]|uniref:hypothetical protein n=1 Tax=unclassified Nostoc TaxID=2593658 RepID=UPI0025AAEE00|nr:MULTISPECIES: hypothetical protein [unclassified Nostoc]MDM9581019.1 hypothetical protein [Nostoc sp. GT001]MDZ7948610.1 hypothetical protein [Nostoc sp. EfeVER01]MDZ7991087.1 hypothetical protein [Nostoc sp. EspVER01]